MSEESKKPGEPTEAPGGQEAGERGETRRLQPDERRPVAGSSEQPTILTPPVLRPTVPPAVPHQPQAPGPPPAPARPVQPTHPVQPTNPVQPTPLPTRPVQTGPVQTGPVQTRPVQQPARPWPETAAGATSHDHGETTRLPSSPEPSGPHAPPTQPPVTQPSAAQPPVTQPPPVTHSPPITQPPPATAAPSSASGTRAPFAVGSLIADRYQVRKVLGVGGMGEVYRVFDQALGIDVALKVLRSEMAHDESFLQRFRNELLVARQVTHPNVVRIHDLGQHRHLMFMTMDLVEGRSLGQLMEEEGQLEKGRALTIIRQVTEALCASHERGVVHRDLKPANILLDAEERAYVTDFGIARSLHFSGLTRTGEVLGTPDYLAPEQARGEEVGPYTDLYSLGLIFFEMVSGKRPFAGGTLVEVLAQHMNGRTRTFKELGVQIDPAVEAVVARCLAADPGDRYASATELLADIDDLDKPRRRAQAARARKLGRRIGLAAAAAALVAALGVFVSSRPEPPPPAPAPAPAPAPEVAALPAVVLLPLANRTGDAQFKAWAEAGIPEELELPLLEAGAVRVVQGRRVQRTLDDLGFAADDLADGDLQTLADVLDARHLVTGSLLALDDQLQLTIQLVELESDGVQRTTVYDELRPRAELLASIAAGAGSVRQALELPESPPSAEPASGLEIPEAARQAYYEGVAHRDAGRLDSALEALERATELGSGYAEAWLALAELHRDQGRSDQALEAAEQAAAVARPGSRTAFEARAAVAVASGRPDMAQDELRALVERFPSDMEPRLALARAHGVQGQLKEAIDVLDEARQLDPAAYEIYFLLGQYSILSGNANTAVDEHLIEAQKLVRRARDVAGEARVLNALGVGHEQLGELDRAIDSYRQAAGLYGEVGDVQGVAKTSFNLGNLHVRLGDHEAAESFLGEALEIQEKLGNPFEQAKVINAFGVLEEERGRYNEALEQYRRALQLRRGLGDDLLLAESFMNVGLVHTELGNFTDAELNLGQALERFETAGSPFGLMLAKQRLGSCHIAQGRWREALTILHEALEISRELGIPNAQAVSHGLIGEVAHLQGRSQAALESYGAALEILAELEDRRGQVEFTLARAETLLELVAREPARAALEQARTWLAEGGGHAQLSTLNRLDGAWNEANGDEAAAGAARSQALDEAAKSGSVVVDLEARLAAAGDLATLRELWGQTSTLGHVPLQLQSAEALAGLALADGGDPELADDVLRRAQSLVRSSGGYAGAYRLSLLTAELRRSRGDESGAVRAEAAARTEIERLLRAMPEVHRRGFLDRPAVARLGVELPAE